MRLVYGVESMRIILHPKTPPISGQKQEHRTLDIKSCGTPRPTPFQRLVKVETQGAGHLGNNSETHVKMCDSQNPQSSGGPIKRHSGERSESLRGRGEKRS